MLWPRISAGESFNQTKRCGVTLCGCFTHVTACNTAHPAVSPHCILLHPAVSPTPTTGRNGLHSPGLHLGGGVIRWPVPPRLLTDTGGQPKGPLTWPPSMHPDEGLTSTTTFVQVPRRPLTRRSTPASTPHQVNLDVAPSCGWPFHLCTSQCTFHDMVMKHKTTGSLWQHLVAAAPSAT